MSNPLINQLVEDIQSLYIPQTWLDSKTHNIYAYGWIIIWDEKKNSWDGPMDTKYTHVPLNTFQGYFFPLTKPNQLKSL